MKSALYHIRIRCNYSQSMLAEELGVSRQLVCAWESGAKPIPARRKQELSHVFGISAAILDEKDPALVQKYCDQAVFSRVVQGRQVFSFKPMSDTSGVCLGTPGELRTAEHGSNLMGQKKALLEKIDQMLRFDPARLEEQLRDMETAVSLLGCFGSLLEVLAKTEPHLQGRVLQFLSEQFFILSAALGNEYPMSPDHGSEQQIHLLRCRWNECNRRSERNMNHSKLSMEQEGPANVLFVINRWYQQAKQMSMSRAELQWKLNQLLEQENVQYYELY